LPSDSLGIISAGMCLPSHCSEIVVCLSACCIAVAVLICFEVSAHQRVYTPWYPTLPPSRDWPWDSPHWEPNTSHLMKLAVWRCFRRFNWGVPLAVLSLSYLFLSLWLFPCSCMFDCYLIATFSWLFYCLHGRIFYLTIVNITIIPLSLHLFTFPVLHNKGTEWLAKNVVHWGNIFWFENLIGRDRFGHLGSRYMGRR
jgi:hypothetical protein